MNRKTRQDVAVEVPSGKIRVQTYRAGIQQRHREPNKRNYIVERRWGDDWYADGNCWVDYERVIDHSRDLYWKRYVDQETRDVIYEVRERLSEHRKDKPDTDK